MEKQLKMFDSDRRTARHSQRQILFPRAVPGIEQPFQLEVDWDIDLQQMNEQGICKIDPKVLQAAYQSSRGLFKSSWYCFASLQYSMGYVPQIANSIKPPMRLACHAEGMALVRKFPNFPSDEPIWDSLSTDFQIGNTSVRWYSVLNFGKNGWEKRIFPPAVFYPIRPQHLVLVHCHKKEIDNVWYPAFNRRR